MFLDSNHVLKVYFKPSRKNQDFLFLPLCSVPVWLKIRYLICRPNDTTQVTYQTKHAPVFTSTFCCLLPAGTNRTSYGPLYSYDMKATFIGLGLLKDVFRNGLNTQFWPMLTNRYNTGQRPSTHLSSLQPFVACLKELKEQVRDHWIKETESHIT